MEKRGVLAGENDTRVAVTIGRVCGGQWQWAEASEPQVQTQVKSNPNASPRRRPTEHAY